MKVVSLQNTNPFCLPLIHNSRIRRGEWWGVPPSGGLNDRICVMCFRSTGPGRWKVLDKWWWLSAPLCFVKSKNSVNKEGDGFLPPNSGRAHCFDPSQLQRKARALAFPQAYVILTHLVDTEVMCQIGSRKVGILNWVAQKSVLGTGEAQLSLELATVLLSAAFQREPEKTCLSGKETVGRAPWRTLFHPLPAAPPPNPTPAHATPCFQTWSSSPSPLCTVRATTLSPVWLPNPAAEFRS